MATPSQPSSVTPLSNSTTFVPKATYVPLIVPGVDNTGAATQKFAFVRSLHLQSGEVAAVQQAMSVALAPSQVSPDAERLYSLLGSFEGTPLPAQLPKMAAFAAIPVEQLVSFGNALASVRARTVSSVEAGDSAIGSAVSLLNTALVATQALASGGALPPIGMLNLERLEMMPAGVERGALLATIPLAPQERTTVVQQEWSVTSKEFTSIVTDSLDNYSETGVTENTQLTQATTSQVSHSNQFNINTSASGGIGFVSGSVATSFGSQDQNSQSSNDSRTHALQTTKKASSRVTQSHKTSISISTTTGTSEASTRVLYNPSTTDAIRVDYFSLMRRWQVALYRYGLRMTYDITIPEPGAAMREIYAQLDTLQQSLRGQFSFPYKHSDITTEYHVAGDPEPYYLELADKYGVDVPPPPSPSQVVVQVSVGFSKTDSVNPASFTVPPGYWINSIIYQDYHIDEKNSGTQLLVEYSNDINLTIHNLGAELCFGGTFLWHQSGKQEITLYYANDDNPAGHMDFNVYCVPTDTAIAQWQSSVWTALYNAAQTDYYNQQQTTSGQIAALQQQIQSVDTLTLRREENDEIMRCVLRWLLGNHPEVFMPDTVRAFFANAGGDLAHGVDFTGSGTGLGGDWSTVRNYEDVVNFVNQAVDWDSIIYFLYSYFWDIPDSWPFIRRIRHPDATRQAFLRAGSARVVLTVRKGWEKAWTYFILKGTVPPTNDPHYGHPLMTIAQEIADYDSTNYPGIPPANPNNPDPANHDDTPQVSTTCSEVVEPSTEPVTLTVADSTGFIPGAYAIIDTHESGVQEKQIINAVNTDTNQITVAELTNQHVGFIFGTERTGHKVLTPFPVVQAGSKGLLIAEWFEYTPTSGTDIAINSDLSGTSEVA
jgi:hypothetical protein